MKLNMYCYNCLAEQSEDDSHSWLSKTLVRSLSGEIFGVTKEANLSYTLNHVLTMGLEQVLNRYK